MIRLALLRHGPTAWNREGRIQGRSDIPLDDAAREDLATLRLPQPWESAALWSSPLLRAADTARLLTGREPQVSAALIEMNWGEWEGQHGKALIAKPGTRYRHIEDWGWNYRPPGGETPSEIAARLAPWLGSLSCDAVAVCHIGIMRVLLAIAHGWDFDSHCPFAIKRNRLYLLTIDGDKFIAEPEPLRLVARENAQ